VFQRFAGRVADKGGLIGAVVGSAVAANTQGPPAVIPGGTVLHVKLRRSVTVPR
jgi:hypothetical protein